MVPDSRAQAAAGRVQAQVEEADAEKRGPAVLVFALKGLERLVSSDIRYEWRTRGSEPFDPQLCFP